MAVRTKTAAERTARRETWARVRVRPASELRTDVLVGAGASLLALLLAMLVLRVWRGSLAVPFDYERETLYYLMLVKGLLDHGGAFENPSLGAPFGLDLHDYAIGTDRLNLELLRLLGLVLGGPAEAVNAFYLLTFALAAGAAYLCFRLVAVARPPAVVCATLFALAPYHFSRGQEHLFLSAYWVVPLGAYLVLATLAGEPLYRRRPGASGVRAFAAGRTLLAVVFAVAAASAGVYYAAFTLLLLGAATFVALLAGRGRVAVASGVGSMALMVAVLALHLAPTVAYRFEHGVNPATVRPRTESELYALKLSDLVFPVEQHRLRPLADFTDRYRRTTPIRSEGGQALGAVGAVGFAGLVALGLVSLVRRRVEPPVARHAAVAAVVALLIGTVGGVSTVVAYLFTTQLRGWNRISIYIAFFSFLGIAVALGWLGRRVGAARGRRAAFGALLAAVLAFGVFDQSTDAAAPRYELATSYRQDREFVRRIEATLPRGASVFVLPYVAFPETGQIRDLFENDLLRGYLHSEHLRWSAAAMKGRPEDWVGDLSRYPLPTILDGGVAAGFSGLYVDRFAYADRASGLEAEVQRLTGAPPLVSESGRQSFFDLRAYGERLRTRHGAAKLEAFRRAVLHPLEVSGAGFATLEHAERVVFAWAEQPQAELRIDNLSDETRTVSLDGMVERVDGTQAEVQVALPGRPPAPVTTPVRLIQKLEVPPGVTTLRFSTAAAPAGHPRPHYFRVQLTITDDRIVPFLPRG
jgi:hypothetical protein